MTTPVETGVEGRSTGTQEGRRTPFRRDALETALTVGKRLIRRLRVIDFTSYEPLSATAAVGFMASGAAIQADQCAAEAIALLQRLPSLVFGDACDEVDGVGDAFELDGVFEAVEGIPEPPNDKLAEEIDVALLRLTAPHSWAGAGEVEMLRPTATMLVRELKSARSRLAQASQKLSKWGMITEGEETRRKSLKALQLAIALGAHALPAREMPVELMGPTELEMALRVRRTLMALRESIRQSTPQQDVATRPEAARWMEALLDTLKDLCGSNDYRGLRSNDRYAIQGLRTRISAWFGSEHRAAHEANAVLRDAAAFAELLSDINKREILVQHDRCLRNAVLTDLAGLRDTLRVSTSGALERFRAALGDARGLADRDQEIARWLDRDRTEVSATDIAGEVEETIERLEALHF
jgi:hypothetical protein